MAQVISDSEIGVGGVEVCDVPQISSCSIHELSNSIQYRVEAVEPQRSHHFSHGIHYSLKIMSRNPFHVCGLESREASRRIVTIFGFAPVGGWCGNQRVRRVSQ